jgi:molybdenum cofactor synthesis domain-containing protein
VQALRTGEQMADDITRRIAGRAIVFSTGPEVSSGQIRDTNKPWISERLRAASFSVTAGEDLPDDADAISAALGSAGFERGFGIVVTTGGVGAEGKDHTVEALLTLDNEAATPPLFTVSAGSGRHQKGQVRIGVGQVGTALVVCLPGPHEEATLGAAVLIDTLSRTRDKSTVATAIAEALRERLRSRHHHGGH